MFAGTCIGAFLAVVLYSTTADRKFLTLILMGFILGLGVGAARIILEGRGEY
jgi:thiol:disulfide interchange protein